MFKTGRKKLLHSALCSLVYLHEAKPSSSQVLKLFTWSVVLKLFTWSVTNSCKCLEKSLEGRAAISGRCSAAERRGRSWHSFAQETWHGRLLRCRNTLWPFRHHFLLQSDPPPLPDSNPETQREGMLWEVQLGRNSLGCERSGRADTGNSSEGAKVRSLYRQGVRRRVRACRVLVRGTCFLQEDKL